MLHIIYIGVQADKCIHFNCYRVFVCISNLKFTKTTLKQPTYFFLFSVYAIFHCLLVHASQCFTICRLYKHHERKPVYSSQLRQSLQTRTTQINVEIKVSVQILISGIYSNCNCALSIATRNPLYIYIIYINIGFIISIQIKYALEDCSGARSTEI